MTFTLQEAGGVVLLLGGVVGMWWASASIRSRLDAMATKDMLDEVSKGIAAVREELIQRIATKAGKDEVINHANLLLVQGQALASIKAELEGLSRRLDDGMERTNERITEVLDLMRQLVTRK